MSGFAAWIVLHPHGAAGLIVGLAVALIVTLGLGPTVIVALAKRCGAALEALTALMQTIETQHEEAKRALDEKPSAARNAAELALKAIKAGIKDKTDVEKMHGNFLPAELVEGIAETIDKKKPNPGRKFIGTVGKVLFRGLLGRIGL